MASYSEAKEAVSRIAQNFGHLDEEKLDRLGRLDPDLRREVEESLLAKDRIAGHAIITLAQNIYGSDARFVFELLQNADDNNFAKALASGASPAVSFHVYADRIVVECNEDGFTRTDLEAICAVGQSSKSASHGYIGAKGIGFKSVFIAAWKVHVQSGHFSFYFKHRRGDSGLGMAVPIWQDTDQALQSPLTRMTLYLHGTEGKAHLQHLRETVFQQLSDLQETSLLFLRKLKKISVHFYDEHDRLKSLRSFECVSEDGHNVSLETTQSSGTGNGVTHTQRFHVTKHMASGLSTSLSRQIPDTEAARRAAADAEVILAFPLDQHSKPVLEDQQLFAFLPVRQSEFKFIIHSDFDTSANRQDIITTSRRNVDLLDAIADAFIKAVLEFCEHPDLRYTWPNFLPQRGAVSTTFWKGLMDKIHSQVSTAPVLLPRDSDRPRTPRNVVILPADFKDEYGNPLLDNPSTMRFLSDIYSREAVDVLTEYGIRVMHHGLAINLLTVDLAQPNSRMKSASTSQGWHSRMAKLLAQIDESRLRALPLYPLRNGTWVSPGRGPVYLPTVEGISVPLGVDLPILEPSAVNNPDRKVLFERLGAVESSVVDVRERIRDVDGLHRNLHYSKSQLHFLYLSQLCEPRPTRSDYESLKLHTDTGDIVPPWQVDVFLPTEHPYGAQQLLAAQGEAPGHNVRFIHPAYLVAPPESQTRQLPPWKKWLCDFVGVREHLRLVSKDGNALSDTWTYVATHRTDELLGLLHHLWRYEGTHISRRNDHVKAQLQGIDARRLCSPALSRVCLLKQTYLPLAFLKRGCARYMEQEDEFPFLGLDSESTTEQLRTKWFFLHEVVCVGVEDDLEFLLDILLWIKTNSANEPTLDRRQRLVDLYIAIDAKCVASAEQEEDCDFVAGFIADHHCLYIPGDGRAIWTNQSDCVWDGPPDMLCRYSLRSIFAEFLDSDRLGRLKGFFQHVLGIPDASWEVVVEEIEEVQSTFVPDIDRTELLYEYISAAAEGDVDVQRSARATFGEKALIFAVRNGVGEWYKSSECLWSSTTDIRGKVTLNDHYEDLRGFFVETLGVRNLTLQMVYEELLQTNPSRSLEAAKSALWSLNALLHTEPRPLNPVPLLKQRILPVSLPDGSKNLVNVDVDFSIGDREYLVTQFRGQIKMLDYDLAEVRQMKAFLTWADLWNRNLSESVKAITSVGVGQVDAVCSAKRDLKCKAHALLRLAATFNSPRYGKDAAGLYTSLRSLKTVATDDIRSISSVVQDGRAIEVESRAAHVHIAETNNEVTVYVPRDQRKRDFCFASALPARLADWLMRDSSTLIREEVDAAMVTALTTVLAVPPSAISLVLDHQGIVQVPITNEDVGGSDDDDQALDTNAENAENAGENIVSQSDPGALEIRSEHASVAYSRSHSYGPPSAVVLLDRVTPVDSGYRELLGKVVRAARSARFPSQGSFDMAGLRSALTQGSDTSYDGFHSVGRYHADDSFERNFNVGAAGELYIFEIFRSLGRVVRNWSLENWQSNIRGRVAIHEDYVGLRGWGGGPETADFVYSDEHHDMTALLIDHGYLDADAWSLARPTYYLEVKTTTGPCGTPFYMSKNQYRRMMDNYASAAQQREVYVILRVYEIENEGRMGMKVYVDPQQLRLDGQLVFTGESWSVTPGPA